MVTNLSDYAEAAIILREAADQLIERLHVVKLKPQRIVEITHHHNIAYCADRLKKRYPSAELISINNITEKFSLTDQSVDLIMGNILLFDAISSEKLFQEIQRILAPEGLFIFSSLGPDTLGEIPDQFQSLKKSAFIDMHDIGDQLVKARFSDPVLDIEYIILTYREQEKLAHELYLTGFIDQPNIPKILPKNAENLFEVTYEMIYGHTWGTNNLTTSSMDENGTIAIPFSQLRKQLLGR